MQNTIFEKEYDSLLPVPDKEKHEKLTSKPKEALESIISEIEEGANANDESPASEQDEIPDASIPLPAELRHLDTTVSELANNFCARLRMLVKNGGIAEMKPSFRAYIYTLEELYERIPEYD